ncbi:MAG: ribokinase [Actinobacteria bacterium]|nr:MAG: ribokinase [Actinomycetota bacterium]TMK94692.1 MAG: ribokinase [Actinomycetota bacterium]
MPRSACRPRSVRPRDRRRAGRARGAAPHERPPSSLSRSHAGASRNCPACPPRYRASRSADPRAYGCYGRAMRLAVVGHIEWIRFARVRHVPSPGGIEHATETWQGAGGGGAVAAVQLAKLGGTCLFLSALGDDPVAGDVRADLLSDHVELHAAERRGPTRTAFTMIDDTGERTIITIGERLEPHGEDGLPWDQLGGADGVFFTAGDVRALRAARRARVVVATSRVLGVLADGGLQLDAIVGSADDPAERYEAGLVSPEPRLVVRTEGPSGGSWEAADGARGRYAAATPPGPIADMYGAGDSFQAGLTFGLASGLDIDAALALAARCGAFAVTGRGPTGGQLTASGLRA